MTLNVFGRSFLHWVSQCYGKTRLETTIDRETIVIQRDANKYVQNYDNMKILAKILTLIFERLVSFKNNEYLKRGLP